MLIVQKIARIPNVKHRRYRVVDLKLIGKRQEEGNTFQDCRKRLLDQLLSGKDFTPTGEKSAKERRIDAKISSGAKLTPAELSYLRRNAPELYTHVLRVQHKRESVLNQLKSCKSRQEAEDLVTFELGTVSKNDPDKEMLIAVIQSAHKEFKQSTQYQQMPEQEPEANQRRGEDIWYCREKNGGTLAYCVGKGAYQETFGLEDFGKLAGFNQEG